LVAGLAGCGRSDEDIRTTGPGASEPNDADAGVSVDQRGGGFEAGSGIESSTDAGAAPVSPMDEEGPQQVVEGDTADVDDEPVDDVPVDDDAVKQSKDAGAAGKADDAGFAPANPGGQAACAVTPVSGLWVGQLADPTMLLLQRTEEGISGWGCIGLMDPATVPEEEDDWCAPVVVLEDHGRALRFILALDGYSEEVSLTLSPERNALFGDYSWAQPLADADPPRRGILVPHPDQPTLLDATSCSGGEPGGECFDAPLVVDGVGDPWVTSLPNDDLLLTWRNDRGDSRLAFARFEGATSSWQAPRFVNDEPIDAVLGLDGNSAGSAAVAWTSGGTLWTQQYEAEVGDWSAPRLVRGPIDEPGYAAWPLVAPDGDTTLVWRAAGHGYVSDWQGDSWEQQLDLGAVAELDVGEGVDGSAVMVFQGPATSLLRWSRRRPGEVFSAPAPLPPTGDTEARSMALTVASDGDALVLWQETLGVFSSYYSSETDEWSEPSLVLETEDFLELRLTTDADGTVRAGILSYGLPLGQYLTTYDTDSGSWSEPITGEVGDVPADDRAYHASDAYGGIFVSPADATAPPIAQLVFGDCDGY
jgi:hypothetical protein